MNNEQIISILKERDICINLLDAYGFEDTLSFDFWDEYTGNLFVTLIAQEEYKTGKLTAKQYQYYVNAYRYIYKRLIKAVQMVESQGIDANRSELKKLFNETFKKAVNRNKRIRKDEKETQSTQIGSYENHAIYGEMIRNDYNAHASRWGLTRI